MGGVLNITAAAWTAGFLWRSRNKKRTQNVSEYMLVLALCLGSFLWPLASVTLCSFCIIFFMNLSEAVSGAIFIGMFLCGVSCC